MNRSLNRIHSKIADISQLSFYPLPTRPTKVEKAMRYGNTHVLVGANGRIYTSQAQIHSYWTSVQRMANTVRALIAMNMLTQEAVNQHREAEAAEREASNKRHAAQSILDSEEHAGLKLTAAQRKHLKAAAKRTANDE